MIFKRKTAWRLFSIENKNLSHPLGLGFKKFKNIKAAITLLKRKKMSFQIIKEYAVCLIRINI
jgi:hypothetical protein